MQVPWVQICSVDPAIEITGGGDPKTGILAFMRANEHFAFRWVPLGGTRATDDAWTPNTSFDVDCRHVRNLQLQQNPLSLSIYRSDNSLSRRFSFPESEFVAVAELIEQLLVNGVAVPYAGKPFALDFYSRCQRGVFPYAPPHIQLPADFSGDLATFWGAVHDFFRELIMHLDTAGTLPRDPAFPLGVAAEAAHQRVMQEIDEFEKTLPQFEKVTKAEWLEMFDENGKMRDPAGFRTRAFHGGVEEDVLADVLPFVFGVYPMDSTASERAAIKKELDSEFALLLEQALAFNKEQLDHHKRLAAAYRVITHDVGRTDRQLAAFKETDGPGLTMVTQLLQTYCVFNPPIGYLQGMNDLFVPILLGFLPRWNEDGMPVDAEGNVVDHMQYMSIVFWCFNAMLRNVDHLDLLANVTTECQKLSGEVHKILKRVSPVAAIWMKRAQLKGLLWLYSDFVLLFKRSFTDVWAVWMQLNCSPSPGHWLAYFVAALLMRGFGQLRALPNQSITTMMEAFPHIMTALEGDMRKLGATALWLAERVPPPSDEQIRGNTKPEGRSFQFFETDWTGPSAVSAQK